MIDGESTLGQRITHAYHGTEVQPQNRGVETCQNLWNMEIKVGSFDGLILNQLENAKKHGRRKVTILDIGSGKGNLFRDFLSRSQLGTKTRDFLAQHKDFTIDFIGITDAQSADEFLQEQEIKGEGTDVVDNSQLKATNIKYTLTSRQRLKDVLQDKKTGGIDLCVSTQALLYLGPNVFENTLIDVINNLYPGGQMVAYNYSSISPGIIQPDPMFFALDIGNIQNIDNSPSLKATLRENGMRFARIGINQAEEEKRLEDAESLMVRLGIRSQEEIDERIADFLDDPDIITDRMGALIRRSSFLQSDESKLINKQILKLRKIKKQKLTKLFETYKDKIEGVFKDFTIVLKRK